MLIDENAAAKQVLEMGYTMDLVPHYFKKGGNLHLYLLLAAYSLYGGWLIVAGDVAELKTAAQPLVGDTSTNVLDLSGHIVSVYHDFVLVGRLVSVITALATVALVYYFGKRIHDERAGLVGAGLLAVTMGFALNAHLGTEDALLTLLILTTLYLVVRFLESGERQFLLGAALAAGLATSAKATGGLVFVVIGAAMLREFGGDVRSNGRFVLLLGGLAAAAYALTTPTLLLDPAGWQESINRYVSEGHLGGQSLSFGGRLVFVGANTAVQAGMPLAITYVAAIGYGLRRSRGSDPHRVVVGFLLLHVLVMAALSDNLYYRLMPVWPLAALLAGGFVTAAADARESPRARRLILAVAVFVFLFSAAYTGVANARFADDARIDSTTWIAEEVDAGDEIYVYAQQVYLPRFPAETTVRRFDVPSTPRSNWGPGIAGYECNDPDYIVASSAHFRRYYVSPGLNPDVRTMYDELLTESKGYAVANRFGPQRLDLGTDWVRAKAERSLLLRRDLLVDQLDPTIVVFERTEPPDEDCEALQSSNRDAIGGVQQAVLPPAGGPR